MRRLLAVLLACACLTPAGAAVPGPASDALEARAFEIRYRGLTDAAELVGAVLSPDGQLKLQPRLKTLVVEDHASVLSRVESLLKSFDLPPRNVEVTLTLLLGTDTREQKSGQGIGPGAVSREIRGIHETLSDFTKWTNYELLGSQSVTVLEGHTATLNLSDEYRVTLDVTAVRPPTATAPQGVIHFRSVVLRHVLRNESGEERSEEIYSTDIQLPISKLLMVGAARSPESRKALFLTIKARPV